MSKNVVSNAISVKSIYYYTHDDGTQEIKRAKDIGATGRTAFG